MSAEQTMRNVRIQLEHYFETITGPASVEEIRAGVFQTLNGISVPREAK